MFCTNIFMVIKTSRKKYFLGRKKSICIGCHTYLTSQFLIVPPFRAGRLSSHLSITMSDPLSKLPSTEIHHNLCILSELFPLRNLIPIHEINKITINFFRSKNYKLGTLYIYYIYTNYILHLSITRQPQFRTLIHYEFGNDNTDYVELPKVFVL